jgi:hypothetical protein
MTDDKEWRKQSILPSLVVYVCPLDRKEKYEKEHTKNCLSGRETKRDHETYIHARGEPSFLYFTSIDPLPSWSLRIL